MEIQALLSDLKAGRKKVRDLVWKEIEEITYYLVITELNISKDAATIEKFIIGEIDIVISYRKVFPFQLLEENKEYENIFIECKHYSSKIPLTTAAKVFCAGIFHQPRFLIIVSSNPLYPQALEYAERFFDTGHNKKELCFYKSVRFVTVSVEKLLGIENNNLDKGPKKGGQAGNDKILSWEVVEEGLFFKKPLFDFENFTDSVLIESALRYNLRIWLSLNSAHKDFSVSIIDTKDAAILAENVTFYYASDNIIKIDLDVSVFFQTGIKSFFICESKKNKKTLFGPINLPPYSVAKNYLPEINFRKILRSHLLTKINLERHPLIFVHGVGGVGKSFFCEKIASNHKSELNYRCHQITVTEDSSLALFIRFIWPVIAISQDGLLAPNKNDILGKEAMRAILSKNTADLKIADYDEFITNLTELNLNSIDKDVLLTVCAKLISTAPTNNLFFIKDTHKLSGETIKYLNILFKNLNDFGWGNVKFILEYRDELENKTSWSQFVRETFSDLKNLCVDIKLQTLTEKDIEEILSRIMPHESTEEIAALFIKKTNGNILFFTQLLDYFTDLGYIKQNLDKNILEVVDFWGMAAGINGILPVPDAFLEQRIETYFDKASNEERPLLIAYLGISSIIGFQIREDIIQRATQLSQDELKVIRNRLVRDNFLKASFSYPPAVFIHELMQKAIEKKVTTYIEFDRWTIRLEKNLDHTKVEDAVVGGKINYAVQNYREAYEWFNIGYELSVRNGDYKNQRICLRYLKEVLETDSNFKNSHVESYINILASIGKNDLYTGSYQKAIEIQKNAIEIIKTTRLNENLKSNYLLLFTHYLLTIYVDLLYPLESLVTCFDELKLANDEGSFSKLLNRLILLCSRCNQPDLGVIISKAAINLHPIDASKQLWSVLYSDIGELYVISFPEITKNLWEKSLSYAESPRQKSHSQLNLLVLSLHQNTFNDIDYNELLKIEKDVDRQGVEGLIVKIDIIKACIELNKDSLTCKFHFQRAYRKSLLYNFKIREWQCANNLAILFLKENNFQLARSYFLAAYNIIMQITDFDFKNELTRTVFNNVIKKSREIGNNNFTEVSIQDIMPVTPKISGSFTYLLFNVLSFNNLMRDNDLKQLIINICDIKLDANDFAVLNIIDHVLVHRFQLHKFIFVID